MNKKGFLIIALCIVIITIIIISGVILLRKDKFCNANKVERKLDYWYVSETIQGEETLIKVALVNGSFSNEELKKLYEKYTIGKENCKMWFYKSINDANTLEIYNVAEIKKENGEYKIRRHGEETEEEKNARLEREEREKAEKLVQEEIEFKASCSTYTFKEIARNPENFKGTNVKLTGEVIQTIYGTYSTVLRVNITKEGNYTTYYSDTVYVTYYPEQGEDKILEDDIITIWGTSKGDTSYTSTMGGTITLPHIEAKYITINE